MHKAMIATLADSDWKPTASGDARLQLSPVPVGRAGALSMDYDFRGGGGFVVARQDCRRAMPAEYGVHFRLRGSGAVNDLEIKLVDASGLNVWRYVLKALAPPRRWRRFSIGSADLAFAWGPSGGERMTELGAVELAIVAAEGGAGTLLIADVRIEDQTPPAPHITTSSALAGSGAAQVLSTGWRPRPSDERPWIEFDLHGARQVGGFILEWLGAAPAGGFRIRHSLNGRSWHEVYHAHRAGGTRGYVYLPGLRTRRLRLEFGQPVEGLRLSIEPFDFSSSIEAFWHGIARREPRGWLPRWLYREQALWTPSGIPDGTRCVIMNEDGLVEPGFGSFSLEPLLLVDDRLIGWTDVQPMQSLREDWQPIPAVTWEHAGWRLRIECNALCDGTPVIRHALTNQGAQSREARLFLVVRPFQVTPPWQGYRGLGGVARIESLLWRDGGLQVNGTGWLLPLEPATGFGALGFDEGLIAAQLARGELPAATELQDATGFATGAIEHAVSLAEGETQVFTMQYRSEARASTAAAVDWHSWLPALPWSAGGGAAPALATALTAAAHILLTRDGPALQPGPRRYTRSWIRDGATMAAALLRLGCHQPVRDFIRWYAPFQRADGFVPCCVDREGVDWLVEHDSHGQLIALIADYHAFSADDALLDEYWGHIERAVACIEGLLDDTGLLPISVSHEGYLSQPVHAFWDDFWALRGLGDATRLARARGLSARADRWEDLRTRLDAAVWRAIGETCSKHGLSFLPGSMEWADFDPTATANAVALLDVPPGMDRAMLDRTFDQYMNDWRAKRAGTVSSANYTAYEIRIIGALVRMGRRADALELLRFFLAERRPLDWNQWPEITWKDARAPAHIGDVPHTWIASEYVLALRSLFAYEREHDNTLIIGAGLDANWLADEGVVVTDMPTRFGALSYRLRRIGSGSLECIISAAPRANLVLRPPLPGPMRALRAIEGACEQAPDGGIRVTQVPARIELS